jgi:hypothetical protein
MITDHPTVDPVPVPARPVDPKFARRLSAWASTLCREYERVVPTKCASQMHGCSFVVSRLSQLEMSHFDKHRTFQKGLRIYMRALYHYFLNRSKYRVPLTVGIPAIGTPQCLYFVCFHLALCMETDANLSLPDLISLSFESGRTGGANADSLHTLVHLQKVVLELLQYRL